MFVVKVVMMLQDGKYMLADASRKGPVAILTSPITELDTTTCMMFYYNIPVGII